MLVSGLVPLLLAAQAAGASVVGTVRDAASGTPITGATVTLTDLDRRALTDAGGQYAFHAVPAGPQHVTVRSLQYTARSFHALVPADGRVAIDVALEPIPITLTPVEVRARTAVPVAGLDDDDHGAPFPDRSLSLAAVRHHPLVAEPDALHAAAGGEIALAPEAPSGVNVRGAGTDHLAYVVDGFPIFSPHHSAGTFASWDPDAVARLDLLTATPAPEYPDALAGAVSATTRAPGDVGRMTGALSTTQARAAIDGPLGRGGAGYLVSLRAAFPGLVGRRPETSYLLGEAGDWLAKLDAPALGGRLRLVGLGSENEIGATAVDSLRHAFTWSGRTLGAEWTRSLGRVMLAVRGWSAAGDAAANWVADSNIIHVAARRSDDGVVAELRWMGDGVHTTSGIRVQRGATQYAAQPVADSTPLLSLNGGAPVTAAFVRQQRALSQRTELDVAVTATHAAGAVRVAPAIALSWRATPALAFSGRAARRFQYTQSLRNPEALAGHVFPAELAVAAGAGAPVAHGDLAVVALDYRPGAGVRLGAQAFTQRLRGLALVAPTNSSPFATAPATTGSSGARGIAVEAAANGARYGVVAGYGYQDVRVSYGDTTYVPSHAPHHRVDAGVIVFPAPSASLRVGITGLLGRRSTAVTGPFEWEDCNLLDGGCEFAGTPGARVEPLGATRLPDYWRADVSLRKHWHVRLAGRDGLVAVFATVTNVLSRRNVLAVVVDPVTGARQPVTMRPRAPLVIGLDWRL